MAITSYAELTTAVENWIADTTINARVLEFIALGESMLWRRVRVRSMETTADLTINAQSISLPTRFLAARRLYFSDGLASPEFYVPEDFWQRYFSTTTGRPKAYTVEGDNIVFGPSPDATYTGKILYYQRPVSIADGVPTLFTENPDLYLYAALVAAAPYLGDDPRVITWVGLLDQIITDLMAADRKDRMGAGPLVATGVAGA